MYGFKAVIQTRVNTFLLCTGLQNNFSHSDLTAGIVHDGKVEGKTRLCKFKIIAKKSLFFLLHSWSVNCFDEANDVSNVVAQY